MDILIDILKPKRAITVEGGYNAPYVALYFEHCPSTIISLYLQMSNSYKSMLERREALPAWKEQDNILDTLSKNQVLVVSGSTG